MSAASNRKPSVQRKAIKQQTGNFKLPFESPFVVKWPALPPEDSSLVLARLKCDLACCARNRGQEAKKPPTKQRKVDGASDIASAPISVNKKDVSSEKNCVAGAGKRPLEEEGQLAMRSELLVGINSVTAALEAGRPLRLVLVCKDVSPLVMVQHIPLLCHRHGVPVCAIPGLGTTLAPILGGKSLSALAFVQARGESVFDGIVQLITSKVTQPAVPWLNRDSEAATREPPDISYLSK